MPVRNKEFQPNDDADSLKELWKSKSDDQLIEAMLYLEEYTPEAAEVIKNEFSVRGLILPVSTTRRQLQHKITQDTIQATVSEFKFANLFKGRISRTHFFFGSLFLVVLVIFILFSVKLVIPDAYNGAFESLFTLIFIAYVVFQISLCVRRFHDFEDPGLAGADQQRLSFHQPLLRIFWVFALLLAPGTIHDNKYGNRPPNDAKFLDVLLGKYNL